MLSYMLNKLNDTLNLVDSSCVGKLVAATRWYTFPTVEFLV
jgi:hypothetical protein